MKKVVKYVEMKNKILIYIESCGISIEHLAKNLKISMDKFDRNNSENWNAEELLEICTYLEIDPMTFYTKKCRES